MDPPVLYHPYCYSCHGRLILLSAFPYGFCISSPTVVFFSQGSYRSKNSIRTHGAVNHRHLLYECWASWGVWYKYQPLDLVRWVFNQLQIQGLHGMIREAQLRQEKMGWGTQLSFKSGFIPRRQLIRGHQSFLLNWTFLWWRWCGLQKGQGLWDQSGLPQDPIRNRSSMWLSLTNYQ